LTDIDNIHKQEDNAQETLTDIIHFTKLPTAKFYQMAHGNTR